MSSGLLLALNPRSVTAADSLCCNTLMLYDAKNVGILLRNFLIYLIDTIASTKQVT